MGIWSYHVCAKETKNEEGLGGREKTRKKRKKERRKREEEKDPGPTPTNAGCALSGLAIVLDTQKSLS